MPRNKIKIVFLIDPFPLYNDVFETKLSKIFSVSNFHKYSKIEEFNFETMDNLANQLAILDIDQNRKSDLKFLINLRLRHPKLKIIVTSDSEGSDIKNCCFLCGVSGYISKKAPSNKIELLLKSIFQTGNINAVNCVDYPTIREELTVKTIKKIGLTFRELETLSFVLQGKLNNEIARIMGVGESTIKYHLTSIYKKFGVPNRTSIVSQCLVLDSKAVN